MPKTWLLIQIEFVSNMKVHEFFLLKFINSKTKVLYPLQCGDTPLHRAAMRGHTWYVECLLTTPGIDVNIKNGVSKSIKSFSCYVNNIFMAGREQRGL